MASLTTDRKGNHFVQIVCKDKKRRTIALGRVSITQAKAVKAKIEVLNTIHRLGTPLDADMVRWLEQLSDDFYVRLARAGIVPARASRPTAPPLGEFVRQFIADRHGAAPNTIRNLELAGRRLVAFLGADRELPSVTPGDADGFLMAMREKYASSTAGRTVKRAKQFFRHAVRCRYIDENPFADVKPPGQVNSERQHYVSLEVSRAVLEACPDAEWRLLFALSRFGGLRCPSEHLAIEWTDVNWERSRIRVHSPKTGERIVPLFPELRPYLEDAWQLAPTGSRHVISRYRDPNCNLRTSLLRILARAGVPPWPRLFHNLRATRQTELERSFPLHVVCRWLGNSTTIAARHYLMTMEEDIERAMRTATNLHFPVQQVQEIDESNRQVSAPKTQIPSVSRDFSQNAGDSDAHDYPQGDSKNSNITNVFCGSSNSPAFSRAFPACADVQRGMPTHADSIAILKRNPDLERIVAAWEAMTVERRAAVVRAAEAAAPDGGLLAR